MSMNLLPAFLTWTETVDLTALVNSALESGQARAGTDRNKILRYGYEYSPGIVPAKAPPPWLRSLTNHVEDAAGTLILNAVTINEYLPGQGIAPHVDNVRSFGPVMAILSLGGEAVFRLGERAEILPSGSLLVISGEERKNSHSVDPVEVRRVSLVFRRKVLSR